jgi:hypothetical protein
VMTVPCFEVSKISQSQIIGPLSRLFLAINLQDKEGDKISFFTNGSLLNWMNLCFTDPCTGSKVCRRCGLILQLDLPVCCLSHLSYLVMVSSASPYPGMSFELFAAFLCCLVFSMSCYLGFSDVLLPLLWFPMHFLSFPLQNMISPDSPHSQSQNRGHF